MINHTLSEPLFRQALQQYLKTHAYGNTMHRDLLDAFTAVARAEGVKDWCGRPLNVTTYMLPWMHQQGFPTIVVRQGADGLKQVHSDVHALYPATLLRFPNGPIRTSPNLNCLHRRSTINGTFPVCHLTITHHHFCADWYRTVEADGQYHLAWIMPPGTCVDCAHTRTHTACRHCRL
jgi:hypothetical protein